MNTLRLYENEINSTESGHAMRGLSELLARNPSVESQAMEWTLVKGAHNVSILATAAVQTEAWEVLSSWQRICVRRQQRDVDVTGRRLLHGSPR